MTATKNTPTRNADAAASGHERSHVCGHAFVRPRVLVANDPGAYRDAISRALRMMRPEVEVLDVSPAELDSEYARVRPGLTVCSRLTRVVETGVADWIELYPGGVSVARSSTGGERLTHAQPDFDLILSLVDRLLTKT